MALSQSLVSQFAKLMNAKESQPETKTVTGTAKLYNKKIYVQLDGSDQLTPIASSTVGMKDGDRVTVEIRNHSANITGNATDPAASSGKVDDIGNKVDDNSSKIAEFDNVIANVVTTDDLEAINANIGNLVADNAVITGKLEAANASIDDLEAKNVTITGSLDAVKADIDQIHADMLTADVADLKYATIENLEATNANIHDLEADYGEFKQLSTDKFSANEASIKKLEAEKLTATDAELKYANIDFANIGKAAIESFFSKSGMIGDLVVGEGTIAGTLVGVTIKGDLIEGGTVKADKLVVQGEDGLYYKLNVSGETVAAEQTDYNSLNGSIITAKSVTAEKIAVNDLVAFGATIGGFHITADSLYSGVKTSVNNTTRGTYMNDEGEFAIGDGTNYLKFFKDTDGTYKLRISASELKFTTSSGDTKNVSSEIENAKNTANSALKAANTNTEDLTSLANTVTSGMKDLQSQIDGSISTWFYDGVPTLNNPPANEWKTNEIKNNHLGDLYYDTRTDYAYRFMVQNGTYSWARIRDTDAIKALSDAANAQDTADSKRRIFVTTPKPPYDVGDLWVQGSGGDIKRCLLAKTAGQSYSSSDWVLASKYTDDTNLNAFKQTVSTTYSTKSEVTQTQTQILQTVSENYSTKTELGNAISKEVSDRNSAISQSADSIKSTVSSTYATKTSLSATDTKATSAQTSANAAKNAADKAQSDLNAYKGTVSTTYATKSEVNQTADSIKSEVSKTYTTKSDFNNLEIGGKNILRGTRNFLPDGVPSDENGALRGTAVPLTDEKYLGLAVRGSEKVPVNSSSMQYAEYMVTDISYGDIFTFSFYAKGTASNIRAYFYGPLGYVAVRVISSSNNVAKDTVGDGNCDFSITEDWQRYWVTWKLSSSGDLSLGKYALLRSDGNTISNASVYVCGFKLERGNKATDWTPSPEDMLSNTDADTIYASKSEVTQTADSIRSEVSKTYQTKDAMSSYATKTSLTQTADSIKSEVSKTYQTQAGMSSYATKSYVDQQDSSIKTTVSSVQTTANSALTKATTVEQTATKLEVRITDTEKDVATAQSTADAAKTTANAAKKQRYHTAQGTAGQNGYVRFAQVTFSASYMNRPIYFSLSNRGQAQTNVWVLWSNSDTKDPSLFSITSDGDIRVWAHKISTSTWEIIAKKSEGYDAIYVNDYSNNNGNGCTVTWTDVMLSSVPSGATESTHLAAKRKSSDIDNAAKTATNYLKFDSSGLCVGNMTSGTLGYNALITASQYQIRNGSTVLSSFGASEVNIGNNSTTAQINMCGNSFRIGANGSEMQIYPRNTYSKLKIGVANQSAGNDYIDPYILLSGSEASGSLSVNAQAYVSINTDGWMDLNARTISFGKSASQHDFKGIYRGAKVINASSTSPLLFTSSQYATIVGRTFDATVDTILVMNTNYAANNASCNGCFFNPSSGNIGVFLNYASGTNIQIAYTIFAGA